MVTRLLAIIAVLASIVIVSGCAPAEENPKLDTTTKIDPNGPKPANVQGANGGGGAAKTPVTQ